VLDQEAGPADELVGLLGEHSLGDLGTVVGVDNVVVFGFVLDDEALFQDDVQAGLDVFVLGLVFFLLVGLFGGRGSGSGSGSGGDGDGYLDDIASDLFEGVVDVDVVVDFDVIDKVFGSSASTSATSSSRSSSSSGPATSSRSSAMAAFRGRGFAAGA